MRVTFHQLRIFQAVAETGGVNRAAASLHLAQPTVSVQVKQLSDAVGAPLFVQVGKKIVLTEAGTAVEAAAREVFGSLERLETHLAELKGLKRGRLRLSVVTTAKYFVPRLLGSFCRQFPGIDIALEVGNRNEILSRLSLNLDDLYIMGVPPSGKQVVRTAFVENPIVVIAPPDHPLVGRRRVPLSALQDQPFILRESGSGTRMAVERFLKDHGLRLQVRMELGSNEAIKQAVAGGLGLSLLSLHALGGELARREVALLNVLYLPIKRSWYIVHQDARKLSVVANAFFEFLMGSRAELQRMIEGTQAKGRFSASR